MRQKDEGSVWTGTLPAAALLALAVLLPDRARAQESADAEALLREMSDFLGAQQVFSFSYQSSLEAVTDDFEKLEFVSSGTATVSRPDKISVTRAGGFIDMELTYDGQTLTLHGRNLGEYAQIEAPGTLADLDAALENAGVATPASDLLAADSFDLLMQDVTEAKHVASAFVDGVECEYLTFRTPEHDFQIWIEAGDRPAPRRYVVTSKHVVQAPSYTLELGDWKFGDEVADASFVAQIPSGADRVDLAQIDMLDELPPETEGAQQ